jgi:predicted SprT family Zn-dependent metalloprotease
MDQTLAHQMALELMEHFGLFEAGWRFRWGSGKRQLGSVRVTRRRHPTSSRIIEHKTLTLSRHLVSLNTTQEVRDTILHEIAHALAGVEHGHDAVWKAVCLKIGAKPQRLADESVRIVSPAWEILCPSCRKVVAQRHRRMNRDRLKSSYCRHCGPQTRGSLIMRDTQEKQPHRAPRS